MSLNQNHYDPTLRMADETYAELLGYLLREFGVPEDGCSAAVRITLETAAESSETPPSPLSIYFQLISEGYFTAAEVLRDVLMPQVSQQKWIDSLLGDYLDGEYVPWRHHAFADQLRLERGVGKSFFGSVRLARLTALDVAGRDNDPRCPLRGEDAYCGDRLHQRAIRGTRSHNVLIGVRARTDDELRDNIRHFNHRLIF